MATTRKQHSISFERKLQILNAIENGSRQTDIARMYGYPLSTVSSIVKNRDRIREANIEPTRIRMSWADTDPDRRRNIDKTLSHDTADMNQFKRNINPPVYKNQSNNVQHPGLNGSSYSNVFTLPAGWRREECIRPSGLSTGRTDVFYISPTGQKVQSKRAMNAILGEAFDLSNFDWRSGKFLSAPRRQDENGDLTASKVPRLEANLAPLTRRTSPMDVYKPTIIRSHPECKRTETKHPQYNTVHQLFWEKRFKDTAAVDPETGETLKPLTLPKSLQSAGVPGYESPQLVHSLVNALATKDSPITGQEQSQSSIEKNPCIAVNPLQPMIKTCIVSDEDVRRQEARVRELRQKLENARKKLNPRYTSERYG